MKKLITFMLLLALSFGIMQMNAFAAKEESINQLDLIVTAPMEGAKPSYDKIDGRGYYSDNGLQGVSTRIYKNGIAWFKSSTSYISPGTTETFAANKTYTVKINLIPKGNFEFADNVTAKINGSVATVEACDDGSILVVANITSQKKDEVINQLDISVTAPTEGEKPAYAKIDGVGYYSDNGLQGVSTRIYKNGIAWFKSATSYISPGTTETFTGDSEYTVKIMLTSKEGYKFAESLIAKINGKTAAVEKYDDGSINVSAVFTATKKVSVTTSKPTDTTSKPIGTTSSTPVDESSTVNSSNANTSKATATTSSTEISNPESSVASGTETNDVAVDTENVETNETEGKDNDNNGMWVWIIIAIAVLLAAGGVVTVIIIKKKK